MLSLDLCPLLLACSSGPFFSFPSSFLCCFFRHLNSYLWLVWLVAFELVVYGRCWAVLPFPRPPPWLTVPMLCSHLRASAFASAAFPYEGRASRCFGSFGFSSRDLLYAGQGFVISKRQVVCKHKAETIIGFVLLFQCDHWICLAFSCQFVVQGLPFQACVFRTCPAGTHEAETLIGFVLL